MRCYKASYLPTANLAAKLAAYAINYQSSEFGRQDQQYVSSFGGATHMNQKQRSYWVRTRAKGLWRFVLLYWVLLWGGFMIIGTSIFEYFTSSYGLRLEWLGIRALTWLITGFVTGVAIWFYAEHKYKKSSSHAPSSQ